MKKIIFFILILFSTLLFAQTKQELTKQLDSFFVEENIELEEFIKKFDNSLSFNVQSDALIIYDTISETSYERFFEVSRLLNFVEFYLEDSEIQPKDFKINFVIYSFNDSNVVVITKEFLVEYYSINRKEQIELMGSLF